MFLRFTTDQLDDDTQQPVGVFAVAYRLLKTDSLVEYQYNEIRRTLNWFQRELPIPKRFTRSTKPHREDKGICWFKISATEYVRQVRYLVQLVSEQDVLVREISTKSPGYIIYEDDFQVVAEPFSSTPI